MKANSTVSHSILKFLTLQLDAVRVFSGVAIFASKNECSNPICFRDKTFLIFQKVSKDLDRKSFAKFKIKFPKRLKKNCLHIQNKQQMWDESLRIEKRGGMR